MASWVWILIAVVVVVVVAGLVVMATRQRRTTMLRRRFGPEYDRALHEGDDQRAAEADLRERQKERERLDIRPLAEPTRARFAAEWRALQERFVDEPSDAVVGADELVSRVMSERGYPMAEFEAQAKLISVDHPSVVENYRVAHAVCDRARSQQASTEDMRAALLRYRSLFDDLLRPEDASTPDETGNGTSDTSDRGEPEQPATSTPGGRP